ncbi:hypothetical protein LMG26411_04910 [Cupriavidus numazuensis]|uniref:Lipoprotein n=1 Tax=Cupriavidus numazuensis TaxID=221992 RepID=A0ABN7Q5M4_9BURK|nr:hypothetical protein LMG26411_04910 [Cupriavidus numazuensis]
MRRLILMVSLLVAGCTTTWYKEGATQNEFEHDKAQCTADAYRQFPVSNVSTPIGQAITTPMLTTCQSINSGSYGTTNCTTTGGYVQPPPNRDLRRKHWGKGLRVQGLHVRAGLFHGSSAFDDHDRCGQQHPLTGL